MNNHQNRAWQSTREIEAKRYQSRLWFTRLTIGGILLVLLAAYQGKSLGLGGIGVVVLWVGARVVANYADARTRL